MDQGQIDLGQHGSDNEVVRDLIRPEQARQNEIETIRQALIEGEQIGISERAVPEITDNPLLWQAVDHIPPGSRRSVYKRHSIDYRLTGDLVFVIRVPGCENPEVLGT